MLQIHCQRATGGVCVQNRFLQNADKKFTYTDPYSEMWATRSSFYQDEIQLNHCHSIALLLSESGQDQRSLIQPPPVALE